MSDLVIKDNQNSIRLRHLKWDTGFFGVRSFCLDASGLKIKRNSPEFRDKVRASLPDTFVTAKIPLNCKKGLIDFLFGTGFEFINVEITLQFAGKMACAPHRNLSGIIIEKAKRVPSDAYLLGREFCFTRFHSDKNISRRKADLVWVNYIKNFNLNSSRHLFTARAKDMTVGGIFVEKAVKGRETITRLSSVSVKRACRDKGVGTSLLKCALEWCRRNSRVILVGTQLDNVAALDFYIKNGFSKIYDTRLVLHRWS